MKKALTGLVAFSFLIGIFVFGNLGVFASESQELENTIISNTTGAPTFTISEPQTGGITVSASQFGLSESNTGLANYNALISAIDYCKTNSAYKLTIPTGTYHIGQYVAGQVQALPAIVELNGLQDFILDGQGSTLIFEAKSDYIDIVNCQRVKVINLTLDWNWNLERIQSVVIINNIDPNGEYIDLQFPSGQNISADMPISELVELDSQTLNPSADAFKLIGTWQLNLAETEVITATNSLRYHSEATVVGSHWFNNNGVSVGQTVAIRHHKYTANGFDLNNSNNFTIDNVTIYSTLGIGFVDGRNCNNFQIINSNLIRNPYTNGQVFSSAADGLQFSNTNGYFKLENNEFANCGDDCLNIYNTQSQGITVTGSNQLTVKNVLEWRNPFNVGDLVEIRNNDFSPIGDGFTSIATAVSYNAQASECTITFQDNLPSNLDINSIICNRNYSTGNYIIKNNIFRDNRGRGIYTAAPNGTIENNQCIKNYYPGIFLYVSVDRWGEGYECNNIIVKNNIIDGSDIYKRYESMPGNLVVCGYTNVAGEVGYSINNNIIIQGNTIKNSPWAAMYIASSSNVLVKENTIINPNLDNSNNVVLGTFMLQNSSDILIRNNTLTTEQGASPEYRSVYVNSNNTSNIYYEGFYSKYIPSDDSYVRDGSFANNNYGTESYINVKNAVFGYNRKGYIMFDFSSFEEQSSVSAKLRLFADGGGVDTTRTVAVYAVSDDWSEETITWNLQPTTTPTHIADVVISNSWDQWYEIDVTQFINQSMTDKKISFLIMCNNGGNDNLVAFSSKDAVETKRPQLIIDQKKRVQIATNPIQDSYIRDGSYNNTNYGTQTYIEVKTNSSLGYTRNGILTFEIPSLDSSWLEYSKIRLFASGGGTAPSRTLNIYGLSNETWLESNVTWSNMQPLNISYIGNIAITNSWGQWYELDVSDYVSNHMLDKRVSFLISCELSTDDNRVVFSTKEATSNCAQLILR